MSCRYCLPSFKIRPLSVVSCANIFSILVCCLSLFKRFPWLHKRFWVELTPLFCFCFYGSYSRNWIKQDVAVIYFKKHSAPPRNFIVSDITLRSIIHFKFIFVNSVRKYSHFICVHVSVLFTWHHLFKGLFFFFPIYILASFVIDSLTLIVWVYLWPFILLHPSIFLFLCQFPLFWCLTSGSLIFPVLFFFLNIALAIQDLSPPPHISKYSM